MALATRSYQLLHGPLRVLDYPRLDSGNPMTARCEGNSMLTPCWRLPDAVVVELVDVRWL